MDNIAIVETLRQRCQISSGASVAVANVIEMADALDAILADARRWQKGVKLRRFPEHCGHDSSTKSGYSWYMPLPDYYYGARPEVIPYETPEAAMDAPPTAAQPIAGRCPRIGDGRGAQCFLSAGHDGECMSLEKIEQLSAQPIAGPDAAPHDAPWLICPLPGSPCARCGAGPGDMCRDAALAAGPDANERPSNDRLAYRRSLGLPNLGLDETPHVPYPEFCRHPDKCAGLSYCPRDPTCAD